MPAKKEAAVRVTDYSWFHVHPVQGSTSWRQEKVQVNVNLKDANLWARGRSDDGTFDPLTWLATTEETVLTAEAPCKQVSTAIWSGGWANGGVNGWPASKRHGWTFHHVLGYPVAELPQPNGLSAIRGQIVIRAEVITDISDRITYTEDQAASLEAENPVNSIPADMIRAEATNPPRAGNLKVCLSLDSSLSSVTVPPDVLFASYGNLIGDLRNSKPDMEYMTYDDRTTFAVVTTSRFTLNARTPCKTVIARTVLRKGTSWMFPLVRASDTLRFQALKMRGVTLDRNATLPGHLGDALNSGLLNATPVTDIGQPVLLDDM